MSQYIYPGSCSECLYFDLDEGQFPCSEGQFPCSKCKHNIPPLDPAYETAPELYIPKHGNEVKVDLVNHPPHYTQGNIQCLDAMESAFGKEAVATWCKLNAFKYIWREEHKNGIEDIDKAIFYLNKFKELKASV